MNRCHRCQSDHMASRSSGIVVFDIIDSCHRISYWWAPEQSLLLINLLVWLSLYWTDRRKSTIRFRRQPPPESFQQKVIQCSRSKLRTPQEEIWWTEQIVSNLSNGSYDIAASDWGECQQSICIFFLVSKRLLRIVVKIGQLKSNSSDHASSTVSGRVLESCMCY